MAQELDKKETVDLKELLPIFLESDDLRSIYEDTGNRFDGLL